ncbi:MAG TPA: hypothetical protein VNI57_08780 [Candidatus Saccharimonadales bacterium]|nr:hypothetical protein [Candidatus Saccharimonadales bacterium]
MLSLPAGGVTGIGSLPHTDPLEAVEFVAEVCPEIPFWPQLPQRSPSESAVAQVLAGLEPVLSARPGRAGFSVRRERLKALLRGLKQGPAEMDNEHAAGFFAFKNALAAGRFPHAVAVKGQLLGPVTLAMNLFVHESPFARDSDLTGALVPRLTGLIQWQVDRLSRQGRPIVLFIDEPGLAVLAGRILDPDHSHLRVALSLVVEAGRKAGATVGLHCCGDFPMAILAQVKPDILSFDAFNGMEGFGKDEAARKFIEDGGCVAYGLVPARPTGAKVEARELRRRWKEALGTDLQARAARQSLVTASCGFADATIEQARAAFRTSIEIAASLRAVTAIRG